LVTLLCFFKYDLGFQETVLRPRGRGCFDKQKLELSCGFRCDQIHNKQCLEFSHTVSLLKSDLDVQQPVVGLLSKSTCLALALGVTKFMTLLAMNLVTLCCAA
jgi:hypothetical protein